MTAREWAEAQIKADLENIEDLKAARKEVWNAGQMGAYYKLSNDIRELNRGIKAMREAYGIVEV